jgi:small subunit ribosomal protein S16
VVKIRLKRLGSKKSPFYRIVVSDARAPRDGKAIAELGVYAPARNPSVLNVNIEDAKRWIANGAQPTDTVKVLLKKAGL